MKINIRNNICVIESEKLGGGVQDRAFLFNYCTGYEKIKKKVYDRYGNKRNQYLNEPVPLYKSLVIEDKQYYTFPRGLYNIIDDQVKASIQIEDSSTNNISVPDDILAEIESSLQPESGFDLRKDQISSVYKGLKLKRGIVQLPTGGGKTEVMASTIKLLQKYNPNVKVLVIEPTDILTIKTADRFNNYKLNATTYKDSRKEITHSVTVAHVISLLHDLDENPELLESIDVVFWDECHHLQAETWVKLNNSLYNVEYALGMSALAVNEDHIYERDLRNLSLSESMIIGATGQVIMHVPPKYYIEQGILATPVVFQVSNQLSVEIAKEEDWHKLVKLGINGEERTKIIARIINTFHENDRRVLILVGVKDQAYAIGEELIKLGISERLAISFGSRVNYIYKYDERSPEVKRVQYKGDIVGDFDKGDYDILISTNHLDEGVDLSNLDVCILASGGKKDRRIVQRIGRALRKTKTGKYAYIIDFVDKGNSILEYHARLRMSLFKDLIEVPPDLVHIDIKLEDMESRFKNLEGIN